ncbi:MAG TPA: hypothetical protein PKV27_01355 [Ilumatobacteraceae bacterium]|nr:hypothetical protein [Ilumatobacteraceae bacterium]
MSVRATPRRWLIAVVASALVAGGAGCNDSAPKRQTPNAAVAYSAIVTWFANRLTSDPEPLKVYVEPMPDGSTVSLEVQAKVIDKVQKVADVHFVDERDEAITAVAGDDDSVVVKNSGVLISLGPSLRVKDLTQVESFEIDPNDDSVISRTFSVTDDGQVTVGDVIDIDPPDTVATKD